MRSDSPDPDASLCGSPTCIGRVPRPFKKFADASSKPWFTQVWKDTIAAGFTPSATMNGRSTLSQQRCRAWVGAGPMPGSARVDQRDAVNRVGTSSGACAALLRARPSR